MKRRSLKVCLSDGTVNTQIAAINSCISLEKKLHSGLFTWVHLLHCAPYIPKQRMQNNPVFTHFPTLLIKSVLTAKSLFR